MKTVFGQLPSGETAYLYTLTSPVLKAQVSDLGATLVSLWVPDRNGVCEDVVLGYDSPAAYADDTVFFGATVGRNANRIAHASFDLGGKRVNLTANEGENSLHSGPNFYHHRLWQVLSHDESHVALRLYSPHGDQGFPGNAELTVTYSLLGDTLKITYDGVCDRDSVFNMTNHTYFNLAGHQNQTLAYDQLLSMPARYFTPADGANIPTGELRSVAGTPMDFRRPKPIGQDVFADYEPLRSAGGYDQNFEIFCNPCAVLTDPHSGRTMAVSTDCPGIQLYSGNFAHGRGKGGVVYEPRCGICLETQFFPDAVHHPDWAQPVFRAGERYHSETEYRFTR